MTAQLPIDIYARVSRKGDKEQRSTSGQVASCRLILADRRLPEGETFIDDGRSAWNPRITRPGFEALMARLETSASGGVIVFDLERFTRQPKDGERLIEAALRGLVVLDSDGQLDLTTSSGKKAFRDAMNAAAYYSDRLSDRVRRGKRLKALEGEFNGAHRPYGFLRLPGGKGLQPHPDEAPILREIVARFLAGETQETIAADLNARGLRTAGDGPWSRSALRQVLRRPANAGKVVHDGAEVARLDSDPLISPADFDRVQAMLAARRAGRPNSPKYVCSGIAVCGVCGVRLAGRPRSGNSAYPDGEVRREYWCSPWTYGGCGKVFVDQRALDAEARKMTIAILSDPRHASQIEAAAAEAVSEAAELDVKIAADEQLALQLADRLGRGEISLDRYDAATRPIDRRLSELRERREALGDPVPPGPEVLAATAETWAARWDVAAPSERSTLLRMALRGRPIIVNRADRSDPGNVARRITIGTNT